MPDPIDIQDVRAILESTRTVAVLGAHTQAFKPAHYVPAYLHEQGYRVLPVNPRFVGESAWDGDFAASLTELQEPADLVDVFRRPDQLEAHRDEILAMSPRPRVVWLQQGIQHDGFAEALRAEGITVVQDRCTLADHNRLGL